MKWQGLLNEKINPFVFNGIVKMIVMSLLIFIHQIYGGG